MSTLNLDTIQLVSTERTAPLNGSPSSADYNDSQREYLQDLASVASSMNDSILPLLNHILSLDSQGETLVLNGDTLLASSDATNSLFLNSATQAPLTLAQVLVKINAIVTAQQTQITALTARVTALQTQLASSNQNDIAKAIQTLSTQVRSLTGDMVVIQTQIAAFLS